MSFADSDLLWGSVSFSVGCFLNSAMLFVHFFIAVFCSQSKPRGWGLANNLVFKKVHEKLGFERCKIFVMGSDTVSRGVHDYFMSINIQLMELYGQSECSGWLTLSLMEQNGWRVGSCGKSIEGFQLKIVDPKKNGELGEGKEGEVMIGIHPPSFFGTMCILLMNPLEASFP